MLLFGHRVAQEVRKMKSFSFLDRTLRNGSYERHIWCHTYNLVWVTVRPWTPCYAFVDGELKGIHLYSKCIVRYGNLVLQNLRGSFNITCSFFFKFLLQMKHFSLYLIETGNNRKTCRLERAHAGGC